MEDKRKPSEEELDAAIRYGLQVWSAGIEGQRLLKEPVRPVPEARRGRLQGEIQRRLRRRSARKRLLSAGHAARRAAVFLLILFTGLFTLYVNSAAFRQSVQGFLLAVQREFASYTNNGFRQPPYENVENIVEPGYLPEGFQRWSRNGETIPYVIEYRNQAKDRVVLYEYPEGTGWSVGAGEDQLKWHTIRGQPLCISERDGKITLEWTERMHFRLESADIDLDGLLLIAESMDPYSHP